MSKHIDALLTTLGVPAEDITAINALPEAEQAAFDSKPIAEKVRANYQTQFHNDPAFFDDITLEKLPADVKKKVEFASFGRAANIVKDKLLKGLGMTDADFSDLPDEQKDKIETLIPIIAERYTKTKTGDKQLQEQLIAERRKNEEIAAKYGPDYEATLKTKYEGESNQKVTAAIFNAALIGELSSIPNLKIKASTLAGEANRILNSKYAFERVGDFSVELRQKANPQMKVLKGSSSQEVTLNDALLEIAENEGWIEKKAEGEAGSGKFEIKPGNDGALHMIPPHLQSKISKKIAAEA